MLTTGIIFKVHDRLRFAEEQEGTFHEVEFDLSKAEVITDLIWGDQEIDLSPYDGMMIRCEYVGKSRVDAFPMLYFDLAEVNRDLKLKELGIG
jgi:hypothetical protein